MAEASNITVNVNVNWEPVDPATLALVAAEMKTAREKYTEQHDDAHGVGHLVDEAIVHMTRGANPSLYLTRETTRRELAVAIGLLFNAIGVVDRAEADPGWVALEDPAEDQLF